MAAIHSQFQQYNPMRPPSWRAEYINRLLYHQPRPLRPSRTRDDRWVHEAWEFLREWKRYGNEEADHEDRINLLFPRHPGLFYASTLYGQEDSEWRTLMEANLLASISDERIAEKIGTLPDTVFWYERIYFDVRERLKNPHYIHKMITGRASERAANREGSITAFQRDMVIKLFAYFGGEHGLNFILTGFANNMTPPRRSVDVRQWAEETFNAELSRQGLITTMLLDINKFNIVQVMQLVQTSVQQQQQVRMFGSPNLEMDRNIEKAGQMIHIAMAGGEELLPADSPKRRFRGPVELRSAEQLQRAAGRKPNTVSEADVAELEARLKHQDIKPRQEVRQKA